MHNYGLHRNSQKRYCESNAVYFTVTKTFQNFPYFKEPIFCNLFIEELRLCKDLKKFKVYGFCLIYDHLNLLIQPNNKFDISKVMKSLKENVSRDLNYIILGYNVFEGDTSTCRLRVRKSIVDFRNRFLQKYGRNQCRTPKFKWQKSFYDHIIRDEKDFEAHYDYTVYNFQKHNLPDGWQYTSLNYEDLIDEILL
jgi:REP element-mobilizing transposase RayT